ncbi:hypothetical protein PUN28_010639 [Cardiocondyla obscurior]|uniref:Uncharacterized protein n=1 Tax=Cardiocondyla obscurior TaxID=286306 RepID=A0AAW2FML8_9HYME
MGRRDAPLSSEQRPGHPTPSSPSLGTISFALHFLLRLLPLPPTRPRPHPLPSPPPFTTATATTTVATATAAASATPAVTPLPPSTCHPLLPTAVLCLHLPLLVFLPSFFGLPNYPSRVPASPHTLNLLRSNAYKRVHLAFSSFSSLSLALFAAITNRSQSRKILIFFFFF